MDKNAIKKYAVWARRELISRVSQRAALYEITDKGYGDATADSVLGRVMSAEEKRQRQALITQIREKGYEQVMEEIAYTWFNRFIALRFMEVNGYLPSRVRVFTDDENNFKPQILTEAINMELDGLDMEKVYALKNANDDDALFKYMIIVQCNALSSILPGMFQRISDFTELLFPDNLLREGSVIEQMVTMIPEEDWTDQVQIIGWIYQFYNIEPKAAVFGKKDRVCKEEIPAATQLFTPEWIVRYMVENSLGKLWVEGHPNDELKATWKYYLDEAEQESDVQAQLAEIRKEYAALKPEDILAVDPCQGSGHILAYMFDVLVQIYESYGYTAREAASSIVEHNIWGLDIDDRAAQLAYFSIMMKARQYDRRFLNRGIQPHIFAIQESNNIDSHCVSYFVNSRPELKSAISQILTMLLDAKEYGSILPAINVDFDILYNRFSEIQSEATPTIYSLQTVETLLPLVQVAEALSKQYHIVVTNPPYMGSSNMSNKLSTYVKKHYDDSKADMFAVFIERCLAFAKAHGYQAMITQHAWMFLSSYERLRQKLCTANIVNMAHLGPRAFDEIGGEVVQTTTFVIRKVKCENHIGTYLRLVDPTSQGGKENLFLSGDNRYYIKQSHMANIPGVPVAYWVSEKLISDFSNGIPFSEIGYPRVGMQTSNNDKFLRLWYEVRSDEFFSKSKKWIKYIKGGQFRRWYGNLEYVVWYNGTPDFILQQKNARVLPESELDLPKCTWTDLATSRYSCRIAPLDSFHDISGHCFYPSVSNQMYLLGLTNSVVFQEIIDLLNSSLHYQVGDVARTPVIIADKDKVTSLVQNCVDISKADWDSFETSWDFQEHPLICALSQGEAEGVRVSVAYAFERWRKASEERFLRLKENEEELNRIFINTYGLEEELKPEVEDKDITVRRADLQRDIRSFISYSVGCMFGRYSIDLPGLIYAGGDWNVSNYTSFQPDKDGILPICDDEYFEDDIVGRFVKFVEMVFGIDTLEENLRFIASALGGKGSPREAIRSYFINDFYTDHLKVYQKRPIYWLFDSGKKNGFKCLIYMHRYQPDTIARIRTDYVHEQQSRYRTAIADLESRISNAGTSERVKLSKQLTKLQEQAEELRVYEEKIHHLADQMIRIDLDDGVKHNYAIFQDVLAKIK